MSILDSSKGFTLIEVMVAVLILAIGLLGLAQLQITSLKDNQSAYFRSQASSFASDIFERMRANHTDSVLGKYDLAVTANASSAPSTLAQKDINEWLTQLDEILPNGDGAISCTDYDITDTENCSRGSIHSIEVFWTESDETGGKVTQSFVYEGAL
jgi:type IV pilus assembly protein PilV